MEYARVHVAAQTLKIDHNTSRRHKTQHTKHNTNQQNAIHANRDACKIDHDTSRFRWFCCSVGSVGFRWVPLFRWIPLFLWVPFFLWVPLFLSVPLLRWFRCSVGFRWVPLFRWVPCSVGFRWVSLFRWFLCSIGFRWVPLFPLVSAVSDGSVGFRCSFRINRSQPVTTATQHNTIQSNN